MSDYVVKFYQFKLNPTSTRASFLRSSEAMDRLLLRAEGFVYRSLARLDQHLWQDMVYWEDAKSAAEAERMMSTPEQQAFIGHIDVASVIQTQAKILTQVYPGMPGPAEMSQNA